MVRNLRTGPNWVPGIVAEVLGPITYLVDTDEGQCWKRHADQIKSWIPPIRLQAEPEVSEDTDVNLSPDNCNMFEPPTGNEPICSRQWRCY